MMERRQLVDEGENAIERRGMPLISESSFSEKELDWQLANISKGRKLRTE